MKKETIELRHLEASEGKKLTDGIVYVNEVYLATSEDEGKWHEIDEKDVPTDTEPIADEYAQTEPEE